jgi:leucyl/phenylalanyl-tRNA--protein transferase
VPVFQLSDDLLFPPAELARPDGLLAVGGDLSRDRLLLAYSSGIFPWYSEGEPILWWSPDVRPVLAPGEVHVGRSLQKVLKKQPYSIRFDTAFPAVIDACAKTKRPGQRGTWITRAMRRAYLDLHEAGVVHSCEAWEGERLVGGLYGVALGGAFFGESMFAHAPDASKIAFIVLCRHLEAWGFGLVDSQVTNEHTARFGTVEIPRREFLGRVREELRKPSKQGRWEIDPKLVGGG